MAYTHASATVAHPAEMIKCKLQLQMIRPAGEPKQFTGPIDVVKQTVKEQGITGPFRGLPASFIYRSSMGFLFAGELNSKYPRASNTTLTYRY